VILTLAIALPCDTLAVTTVTFVTLSAVQVIAALRVRLATTGRNGEHLAAPALSSFTTNVTCEPS